MGRGDHEAVAIMIVLAMRGRAWIGRSLIGAVDHESNMITASRFEAVVKMVSRFHIAQRKGTVIVGAIDLERIRTQG